MTIKEAIKNWNSEFIDAETAVILHRELWGKYIPKTLKDKKLRDEYKGAGGSLQIFLKRKAFNKMSSDLGLTTDNDIPQHAYCFLCLFAEKKREEWLELADCKLTPDSLAIVSCDLNEIMTALHAYSKCNFCPLVESNTVEENYCLYGWYYKFVELLAIAINCVDDQNAYQSQIGKCIQIVKKIAKLPVINSFYVHEIIE